MEGGYQWMQGQLLLTPYKPFIWDNSRVRWWRSMREPWEWL